MTSNSTRDPRAGVDRRGFCAAAGAAAAALAIAPGWAAAEVTPRYPAMIGKLGTHVTIYEDTLVDLARRFNLGFTELAAANPGIDPWVPGAGVRLLIPSAHLLPLSSGEGLVLNLGDQRLYFLRPDGGRDFLRPDGGRVESVPIGIGRTAWNTPTGVTRVVRKRANPTWYVPKSIREEQPELPAVVGPGPDNPLGKFAIYLDWPGYLLHGTNEPMGVGRRVSHGCVRLYPEDIERFFNEVAIGTLVTVVDQPMKIAWVGDTLMLELHPDQEQADEVEAKGSFTYRKPSDFEYRIIDAAGTHAYRLDWKLIRRILRERKGVPVAILKPVESAAPVASAANRS